MVLSKSYVRIFEGKFCLYRPQTAGAAPSINKRLSMALYKMSPDMADLIKDALGPPLEESQTQKREDEKQRGVKKVNIPGGIQEGLETIHERLQGRSIA